MVWTSFVAPDNCLFYSIAFSLWPPHSLEFSRAIAWTWCLTGIKWSFVMNVFVAGLIRAIHHEIWFLIMQLYRLTSFCSSSSFSLWWSTDILHRSEVLKKLSSFPSHKLVLLKSSPEKQADCNNCWPAKRKLINNLQLQSPTTPIKHTLKPLAPSSNTARQQVVVNSPKSR